MTVNTGGKEQETIEELRAKVNELEGIAERIMIIRRSAEASPFYDTENTKTALFICDTILEMFKEYNDNDS